MQAETRYADSGGVNIAYQTLGEAPRDLVLVHGWASNIEIYQKSLRSRVSYRGSPRLRA